MTTIIPPEKGDERTPVGPAPTPKKGQFQWVYVVGALVVLALLAFIGFVR